MFNISQPYLISNELADFLEIKHGSLLSRVDVSKEIFYYIKKYNLQENQYSRVIIPDNKLKILFNISDSEQLTMFNIQKYLRPHLIQKIESEPILIKENTDDSNSDDSDSDDSNSDDSDSDDSNSDDSNSDDSNLDSDSSVELSVITDSELLESVSSILNNEIKILKFSNSMQCIAVKNIREIDDRRPICEITSAIEDFKNIAEENKKIQQKMEKTLIKIKSYLIKNKKLFN